MSDVEEPPKSAKPDIVRGMATPPQVSRGPGDYTDINPNRTVYSTDRERNIGLITEPVDQSDATRLKPVKRK
jgi:hypothetical protein